MMKGLLSALLVISFILASTYIVIAQIRNIIDYSEQQQQFNEAKHIMNSLDSTIKQLASESQGSVREFHFYLPKGKLKVSGVLDEITYIFGTADFIDPSTRYKENNVIIEKGPFVSAYVKDIDADGNEDLVLENDRVIFAIKHIGNKDNYDYIDEKNIVTLIKEKTTNTEFYPSTYILINNDQASSSGMGFTYLTRQGEYLSESSIIVHMESPYKYNIKFTLKSGWDFVKVNVIP